MKKEILASFETHFEIEYEIIGDSRTQQLIDLAMKDSVPDLLLDDRGSNMDLVESIKFAFECIATIKTIYDLIEIKNKMNIKIDKKEIEDAVRSKIKTVNQNIIKKIPEIIDKILP